MSVEEFGDHVCKRCSISIPEDRTYCDKHYQLAFERYQRASDAYQESRSRWDAMSNEARERAHQMLDQSQLKRYALGVTSLITVGAHMYWLPRPAVTMTALLITGVIVYRLPALYRPLGRCARGAYKGSKLALGLALLALIIAWSVKGVAISPALIAGSSSVGFMIGWWREGLGVYSPSAEPREPTLPSH